MPNDAKYYADSGSKTAVKHTFDPWVDMAHVESRIKAKYGEGAGDVISALRAEALERFRAMPLTRYQLHDDLFRRNLRTLAYIADGKVRRPDDTTMRQLYTDALASLTDHYPADKRYGAVNPFEVWKYLLDTTRDDAQKAKG